MTQFAKLKGMVAFDFETTGITKFDCGAVRLAGFSDGKTTFWTEDLKSVADFLRNTKLPLLAHNAGFEMRACKENFGFWPKIKADTVALHYLVDESTSHSLDKVAMDCLGIKSWDIASKMDENGWTWKNVPREVLGPYCAEDARVTRLLYDHLKEKLNVDLTFMHDKVLIPLTKVCAKMEFYGIKMDIEYARKTSEEYKERMNKLREEFVLTPNIARAMRKVGLDEEDFNMNSAPQIRKLFCDGLKLKIEEKTETGMSSVREEVVSAFKNVAGVPLYLEWKQAQTIKTNYIDKFPAFADKDCIVRSHMNPCFVTTGRLSVTKPNMQSIPVDPKIRNMFVSRFKKGCIASFDFKQLEMRLVASESNEKRLLDAFERGDDVHDLTAKLLFGEGFEKAQRNIAKRVNFGIVYGAGPGKLVREFNMSWEQAESLIGRFNKAYTNLYLWMKAQRTYVHKHGYVVSRFGRIRRLGDTKGMTEWQRAAIERQAGNFPIQSQGADLTNICLIKAYKEFTQKKLKSKIVLQVHDSIVVDTLLTERDQVVEILTRIMSHDVPKMCTWLRVKIEVDVQIETKWA